MKQLGTVENNGEQIMRNDRIIAKRKTGFTLVELLVVIAIIGILASMLMPAINSARESARSAQCGSNVRNLAVAANSYSQQNRDQLPGIGTGANSGFVQLMPYLEMGNMFDAITGFEAQDDGNGGQTSYTTTVAPIFVCPSAKNPGLAGQSNFAHCAGQNNAQLSNPTPKLRGAFHPSEQTGLAIMSKDGLMNTIFYSEKQENGGYMNTDTRGGAFHAGLQPNNFGQADDPDDPGTDIDFDSSKHAHAHSNHPGGVNAAFGDAHVGFYNSDVSLVHWQGLSTADGGEAEYAGSQ